MARFAANVVSYLFHPLFMVIIMLGIVLLVNPYGFSIQDEKGLGLIFISVAALTVLFPLVGVFMLKNVGFVSSMKVEERMDRIGPFIITSVFYLWLYINLRNNFSLPSIFVQFILGTVIALFLAFFINNFSKISLHTVGIGGLLGGLLIMRFGGKSDQFILSLGNWGSYLVHLDLLIIVVIFIAGAIGTARLYLSAHRESDVYGGYLVGFISQIIALMIFT